MFEAQHADQVQVFVSSVEEIQLSVKMTRPMKRAYLQDLHRRAFALPYGSSSAALAEAEPEYCTAGPCCHCHRPRKGRHVRSGSSVLCSDLLGCTLGPLFTLAVHRHASICFPPPATETGLEWPKPIFGDVYKHIPFTLVLPPLILSLAATSPLV